MKLIANLRQKRHLSCKSQFYKNRPRRQSRKEVRSEGLCLLDVLLSFHFSDSMILCGTYDTLSFMNFQRFLVLKTENALLVMKNAEISENSKCQKY